jgi:hypothetical protein
MGQDNLYRFKCDRHLCKSVAECTTAGAFPGGWSKLHIRWFDQKKPNKDWGDFDHDYKILCRQCTQWALGKRDGHGRLV